MEEQVDIVTEPSAAVETVRLIQFVFDDIMTEFRVDWTQEQVNGMITKVMSDDGYLWVPYDEEAGTGTFVNLNGCTCIRLVEFPVEPDEKPVEDMRQYEQDSAYDYLTYLKSRYGLSMFDGMIGKKSTEFLIAMLMERYGDAVTHDGAVAAIDAWRELYRDES